MNSSVQRALRILVFNSRLGSHLVFWSSSSLCSRSSLSSSSDSSDGFCKRIRSARCQLPHRAVSDENVAPSSEIKAHLPSWKKASPPPAGHLPYHCRVGWGGGGKKMRLETFSFSNTQTSHPHLRRKPEGRGTKHTIICWASKCFENVKSIPEKSWSGSRSAQRRHKRAKVI